jgi:hypothetical protein
MRRTIVTLLLLGGVLALLGGVLTASSGASEEATDALLTIRHANVGCHVWKAEGSRYATDQLIVLHTGDAFRVENRDTCGHTLVQTGGPAVASTENLGGEVGTMIEPFTPGVSVTIPKSGVYTFQTVEDDAFLYGWRDDATNRMARVASSGTDNTLGLTVVVPETWQGALPPGSWQQQNDERGIPGFVWVPSTG